MNDGSEATVVFSSAELLPPPWSDLSGEGPVRVFNPALLRDGGGWLLAYRVATNTKRRIALCRLDNALRVVAGSHVPMSDHVRFRPYHAYPEIVMRWFADPRLYRFAGRLFVYWNSGWHEPQNHQFLQELDPSTLLPTGAPRELLLPSGRRKLEKNWTLFGDGEGSCHAVYSVLPHRVLQFSLAGDSDIKFHEIASVDWTLSAYPACHGGLRGGAPPQRVGDTYWSICHSVHDDPRGYRYAAAAYCFAGEFPFAPSAEPIASLPLGAEFGDTRDHPRLNPAVGAVIYPCGAVHERDRWFISYGVNDERCAISVVPHARVAETVRPVAGPDCALQGQ